MPAIESLYQYYKTNHFLSTISIPVSCLKQFSCAVPKNVAYSFLSVYAFWACKLLRWLTFFFFLINYCSRMSLANLNWSSSTRLDPVFIEINLFAASARCYQDFLSSVHVFWAFNVLSIKFFLPFKYRIISINFKKSGSPSVCGHVVHLIVL